MKTINKTVPVVSLNQIPLMPTSPSKARELIKKKLATPFFNLGIFCIRLNYEPATKDLQPIVLGIDPGSKREAMTVRSKANHILNIQSNAIDWICVTKRDKKGTVLTKTGTIVKRANARRSRRFRNTPCRPPRFLNRSSSRRKGRLPPSTRARWDAKLQLTKKVQKVIPLTHVRIEDISYKSKPGKNNKKNLSFSPLQSGKNWFKKEIEKLNLTYSTIPGIETSKLRKHYKLDKNKKDKLKEDFNIHVVDTAVIAANYIGAKKADSNKDILIIEPIPFNRRSLHKFQPSKGGKRTEIGGIRSKSGFTKGSIIKVKNMRGYFKVGGYDHDKNKLSICAMDNQSCRISRNINLEDVRFICYNRYSFRKAGQIKSKNA